jgi:hypothetical protein
MLGRIPHPAEQAKLLRMVLSNCAIDAANLYPAYRKPFDLIFQAAKTKEWWTLVDDFRTLRSNSLPQPADAFGCSNPFEETLGGSISRLAD